MFDIVIALMALIALQVLYMLPWLVAKRRKHHQRLAILWLNIFLGWTALGWIAALIWASTTANPALQGHPRKRVRPPPSLLFAPHEPHPPPAGGTREDGAERKRKEKRDGERESSQETKRNGGW